SVLPTTRRVIPRAIFVAVVFIAFGALLVVTSRIAPGDDVTIPPPPGDPQDYDNIALQLLRGRGYAIDETDPEWRRPYEEHNAEGDYDGVLARRTFRRAVPDRAPLLPLML